MIINHRSKTLRIEVSDNVAKYKLQGVNIDKLGRVVFNKLYNTNENNIDLKVENRLIMCSLVEMSETEYCVWIDAIIM